LWLPFYLGGEECFCARETGTPDNPGNYGVLDRHAIAEANLKVLFAEKPSTVAGHGFTTGWIPKVSFERPMQPTRMKVGIGADGLGCAAARLPEEKRNAAMMVDDFQHEQATCFNLKGKGLVVITSCGHRGVVNSVIAAIKASGVSKVHAVLGGFHLMPMAEDYARETMRELARLEPDCIIPMHCTGMKFYEAAKEALPGKVLLTSTGTRFTFGSTASASA
jgi:7,8-dihydropterin-6-yl-methyl-4-(beta-D-ribofuranosyl)aminobenzene 5'-phosphate synthase